LRVAERQDPIHAHALLRSAASTARHRRRGIGRNTRTVPDGPAPRQCARAAADRAVLLRVAERQDPIRAHALLRSAGSTARHRRRRIGQNTRAARGGPAPRQCARCRAAACCAAACCAAACRAAAGRSTAGRSTAGRSTACCAAAGRSTACCAAAGCSTACSAATRISAAARAATHVNAARCATACRAAPARARWPTNSVDAPIAVRTIAGHRALVLLLVDGCLRAAHAGPEKQRCPDGNGSRVAQHTHIMCHGATPKHRASGRERGVTAPRDSCRSRVDHCANGGAPLRSKRARDATCPASPGESP
jgi:hypothetical protein